MLLHSRLIVANHATHFNPDGNASFFRPLTSPPCTAMTAGARAGHSAAGMPIIAITPSPSVRPSVHPFASASASVYKSRVVELIAHKAAAPTALPSSLIFLASAPP